MNFFSIIIGSGVPLSVDNWPVVVKSIYIALTDCHNFESSHTHTTQGKHQSYQFAHTSYNTFNPTQTPKLNMQFPTISTMLTSSLFMLASTIGAAPAPAPAAALSTRQQGTYYGPCNTSGTYACTPDDLAIASPFFFDMVKI